MGELAVFPDAPDGRKLTAMRTEELRRYRELLRQRLAALDTQEPEDMACEEYEEWGDRHEELEDQIDEATELLEARGAE